jgi:hypothetical protein
MGTTLSSGLRTYLTTRGVTLVPRRALLVGPSHPGSVPSVSSTTCTTTISDLPYPPAKAGHMAKRRVGVEHSPSMLEPVRPGAVSPDRALYLPTFSHFVIVNKNFNLSLSQHFYRSHIGAAEPVTGDTLEPRYGISCLVNSRSLFLINAHTHTHVQTRK